jgi:hypothetical protein
VRSPVRPTVRPQRLQTFPAPIGGWIRNQNLATPGARRPDGTKVSGAYVLENWFPTATGIRMRRGSSLFATVGNGTEDVVSLFTYINGNNKTLFAATGTGIYDSNAPVFFLVDDIGNTFVDDAGNSLISVTTNSVPLVSGQTNGNWITVQTANASGSVFLRAVNGSDTPLVYDGAAWSTSPAITGVDPTTLSYVWSFKRRTWFIQKDSLNAWYLAADAIGGAAVQFPLAGIFTRGGSLVFGSGWSLESSGGGLSEQQIFVTSEGEIAVYQGDDPSVAASWSLVGVYRTGKPLGSKAHIRAGGDVLIATDIGLLPVSTSITRDYAALSPAAVSYNIETAWNEFVASRSFSGWTCEVWPTEQMVAISLPTPTGSTPTVLVANARTGAWAPYTGWNALCLQTFNNRLFFGSTSGKIIEAEVTGLDQDLPYTATCVPLFESLRSPASLKVGLLARATVLSTSNVQPQMTLQADYVVSLPPVPSAIVTQSSNAWDVAVWNQAIWDATTQKVTHQQWQSVGGEGYSLSAAAQITSGSLIPPDIDLVSIDLTYDVSDLAT